MKRLFSLAAVALLAGATAGAETPVTEQPAGKLEKYHGTSRASYIFMMIAPLTEPHDGVCREVVFDDNGKDVWFKDPLTHMPTGAWINGKLEDGVITVETPQLIDRSVNAESGEVHDWHVQRLKKVQIPKEDGEGFTTDWVPDTEKTSIRYRLSGDSIIQEKEQDIMLGLVQDGEYYFYGEQEAVYAKVKGVAAKIPEGTTAERWSFFYNNDLYAHQAEVYVDGDDFYLRGFWPEFPDACVKGTINGDRMVMPSGQYLGLMKDSGVSYYTYFMSGVEDEESWTQSYISSGKDMEFAYDKDAKTVSPLFGSDLAPLVRYGKTAGISGDCLISFAGMRMKHLDHIAGLSPAEIKGWRIEKEYGWGSLEFVFRAMDSEGNALDPDRLSYSLWTDSEKYVFDKEDAIYPEAYEGIDEPTDEIPYLFDNDYGFSSVGSIANRKVSFYKLGFKEIGVQFYYDDDISGKLIKSKIAYVNPETGEKRVADEPSGIGSVDEDASMVESVVRYDLNGNRVADAFKGVVVEQSRYADGHVKTSKKIIR